MERMEEILYKASVSGRIELLIDRVEEDGGRVALAKAASVTRIEESPPLHVAALLGHQDLTALLLRHLPNLATQLDLQGRTPLHYAADAGHTLLAKEILASSTMNDYACSAIHVPDTDGNTPLHLAIMNGRLDVVDELISHGALEAVGHGPERAGKRLLHFCVNYGRLGALKSLLKSGKMDEDQAIAAKDEGGNTIFHLATALNQLETVKYLLESSQGRATVNTVDGRGLTALDIAQHMPRKLNSGPAWISDAIINAGGSSAINLRDIDVGDDSEEIQPGAVVVNLEPPPSPSRTETKAPPQQPRRTRSMKKQLMKQRMEKRKEMRINTLMISATLIAAMVYQGALNPPGGVWQEDVKDPNDGTEILYHAGKSVMASIYPNSFRSYIITNTLAFVLSLFTIAALMSGLKRRVLIWILSVAMWLTVSSVLLTYLLSILMMMNTHPIEPTYSDSLMNTAAMSLWMMLVGLWFLALIMPLIMRCIVKLCKLSNKKTRRCFKKMR